MSQFTGAQRKQRTITKTLGTIGSVSLGVPLAWLGYSAALVNHQVPLPPAIQAERRTLRSPTAGELSYYVNTSKRGRPLVLLHSINAGPSAYEMRPLFDRYRTQRPVYALDLPGFGFSERSERVYSPDLYVAAIKDFIQNEVVGDDGVDLVALSLSSEFAARVAHEQPDLVASLALISPTGFMSEAQQKGTQKAQRTGSSDRLYRTFTFPLWSQAFYDALVSRPSLHYFLQRQFAGPVDEGMVDYAFLTTHQPGAKHAPFYFISGKLFTPDIREHVYEQIRQPVLVIYDVDPNVTFDRLPSTLERPNWHGTHIAPTRGLAHFERLEQTVEALDHFWQTQEVKMLER
jgi:pimeloyl-ACP methyl ester carboxylesterase